MRQPTLETHVQRLWLFLTIKVFFNHNTFCIIILYYTSMRKDTHFVNIVIHRFRQILVLVNFTFALTAHLEYVHISFLYTMQPDVMDNTADTHTNRLEGVEPVFCQHKDVVKQSGTDNKANELRPYSQGKLEKKTKTNSLPKYFCTTVLNEVWTSHTSSGYS